MGKWRRKLGAAGAKQRKKSEAKKADSPSGFTSLETLLLSEQRLRDADMGLEDWNPVKKEKNKRSLDELISDWFEAADEGLMAVKQSVCVVAPRRRSEAE